MDANRIYQNRDGSYQLPNDATEHERLDLQSVALEKLAHGRSLHAPVQAPKKILDIGCGTGIMTVQLAKKFPNAKVIGLDISPVPSIHDQPSNVEYAQGDFLKLVEDKDPRFSHGSFDYIFARLLHFGIRDWGDFVRKIHSVLAPGGWAEFQESEPGIPRRPDGEIDHQTLDGTYKMIMDDLSSTGLDMRIGGKLTGYLESVNFHSVDNIIFRWPITRPLPTQPEAEMLYEYHIKYIIPMMSTVVDKISAQQRDEEIVNGMHRWLTEWRTGEHEPGVHCRFVIVVGQKAP